MPSNHEELLQRPIAPSEMALTPRQITAAVWSAVLLLAVLLIIYPYARINLPGTQALLPAYAAAIVFSDLITSALLLAMFNIGRSRALLALSMGYLYVGLLAVPWALSFPGVDLLEAGLQATAALAACRRLGFPAFILAYIFLRELETNQNPSPRSNWPLALTSSLSVIAVVVLLTWIIISAQNALPMLMLDRGKPGPLWFFVPALAYAMYFTIVVALLIRRKSSLDVWLMIVTLSLAIELLLLSYISAGNRLSVGWWAGRLFGLASASVVLIALLCELTTLYRRLILSLAAERRIREDRLAATQALLALVAHEVNQPLTSIVTNAGTGLRWIERETPDIHESSAALRRVIRDGHRASEVIRGIQAMFRKGTQERGPLDINREIKSVIGNMQGELDTHKIIVKYALTSGLPPACGNSIQIQQVISNLVKNSIDAMSNIRGRDRLLEIRTSMVGGDGILVAIEDNGVGMDSETRKRIFEPFYTTKPHGMGMGLLFSRSIVEAHGGTLRVEDKQPYGTAFHFTLPIHDGGIPQPEI